MLEIGALPIAYRNAGGAAASEAENGRDPVPRVEAKLILNMGLGVESRIGLQPSDVVDMPMGVDEPGMMVLPETSST